MCSGASPRFPSPGLFGKPQWEKMKKPKTGMFERDEVRGHQEQVQGKKKAAICPPVRRKVEAGRARGERRLQGHSPIARGLMDSSLLGNPGAIC